MLQHYKIKYSTIDTKSQTEKDYLKIFIANYSVLPPLRDNICSLVTVVCCTARA